MNRYKKYPRTMNLPWSQSDSSDDIWLSTMDHFYGKEVIISEKCDGECTTMYNDFIHARSIDSANSHHASRSAVKALHAQIKFLIPPGWRVVGESMYAEHSVRYTALSSVFYIFNVFDDKDNIVSWKNVEHVANCLAIPTVPVLYKGVYDAKLEAKLQSFWRFASLLGAPEAEGYVLRMADSFPESEFKNNVCKFVRPCHVGVNTQHWMKSWRPNGFAK